MKMSRFVGAGLLFALCYSLITVMIIIIIYSYEEQEGALSPARWRVCVPGLKEDFQHKVGPVVNLHSEELV